MTTDDQNDDQTDPGRLRQIVDEANARAAAAEARAAQVEAREMFRDAGLDLANKQHQAFAKAYDGEANVEAVRSYVSDLGITEQAAPTPAPADPAGTDEQAALVRMAEAARDGAPAPSPDRREQAGRDLDAAMARRAPPQEIARLQQNFSRAGGFPVVDDL